MVTSQVVNDVIFPLLRQMHAALEVLHIASAHQVVPEETVSILAGWLASMADVVVALLAEWQDGADETGGAV